MYFKSEIHLLGADLEASSVGMSSQLRVILAVRLGNMQQLNSKPFVVGAAILDDASHPSQMLAARRKAPKSLAGFWEFPGGKIEPDETHVGALIREIGEELGVEIDVLERISAPHPDGWLLGNGMRMHVFTAVIRSGKPLPLVEHDKLSWVELNATDLHALPWIPADRPILDAILDQLNDHKATA